MAWISKQRNARRLSRRCRGELTARNGTFFISTPGSHIYRDALFPRVPLGMQNVRSTTSWRPSFAQSQSMDNSPCRQSRGTIDLLYLFYLPRTWYRCWAFLFQHRPIWPFPDLASRKFGFFCFAFFVKPDRCPFAS